MLRRRDICREWCVRLAQSLSLAKAAGSLCLGSWIPALESHHASKKRLSLEVSGLEEEDGAFLHTSLHICGGLLRAALAERVADGEARQPDEN